MITVKDNPVKNTNTDAEPQDVLLEEKPVHRVSWLLKVQNFS